MKGDQPGEKIYKLRGPEQDIKPERQVVYLHLLIQYKPVPYRPYRVLIRHLSS
jgi:hypothetical protein